MKRSIELAADIDSCSPAFGTLAFWRLGQHGLAIKGGTTVVYVDPYLSPTESRLVPPLLSPDQVRNADLVLGTHDHSDHIDRPAWPAIAQASRRAIFVLPEAAKPDVLRATGIPPERAVGLDDRVSVSVSGVIITGIAAAHEFLARDPATGRCPFLGYVIEMNGCCIYHAGDTCCYDGMLARLRRWKFDAVFLPINGRDAKRYAAGCLGNMTYQEAADLAGELAPRLVVPAHYDMFAFNPGDPAAFSEYMRVKYPGLRTLVCGNGERVELRTEART